MKKLQKNAAHILEVKNRLGIHVRPAWMIVKIADKYADTDVSIIHKNKIINAKSTMSIMGLAANFGTRLVVTANGDNAQETIKELSDLFERRFEDDI